MKLLRLPASKVQLGHPLPWNVRDADTRLLLSKGQVVDSQSQLDQLLQRGAFVDLEEAKAAEGQLVPKTSESPIKRAPTAFSVWDDLPNQLRVLFEELRITHDAEERIDAFVTQIVGLVDRDIDLALYHAVRQENADLYFYGYSHSIHTAVLCLLLARSLNWSDARKRSLMCAAITMNFSILALQGQMAKQDVPVRESQRLQIRQHPEATVQWLKERGVTDHDWITAVQQHHEHIDGTGYPQGLKEVAEIALALRVADVFMAKISPRTLRAPLSIRDATKQMYVEDKGGPLSNAVIKEFGIYPPGEVVKLVSGETAVVMRRSGNPKCPKVACLTDAHGQPYKHNVQYDTAVPEHAIAGSTPAPKNIARLPPERIYGYVGMDQKLGP
jgi:hypothetical protein